MKRVSMLSGILLAIVLSVATARAQYLTYVTNLYSNAVSVIDNSTNTVTATVPVGNFPIYLAVTPNGKRVYVANYLGGAVSVIDTLTDTVIGTVPVDFPTGVAISPDGTRAYVGNYPNSVLAVDTSTNTVVGSIGVTCGPFSVAITPDGSRLYVAGYCGDSDGISVIDTSTNLEIATLHSLPAVDLAVSPDGTRVYAASQDFEALVVIDTSTNNISTIFPCCSNPSGVALSPDGTRAYVTDTLTNQVWVFDTGTGSVETTIGAFDFPLGAAATPDGKAVYVANRDSASVSVIDTLTNTLAASVPVGSGQIRVAIGANPVVPFSAFSASLTIYGGNRAVPPGFSLTSSFTLGAASSAINPLSQPVNLTVGTYSVIIPAGSFKPGPKGSFTYSGNIAGTALNVVIVPLGANAFGIQVTASGADLTGSTNPVNVRLAIGNNSGTESVFAVFK
jgi:YVTN family beta-propeller protein